MKVEGLNDKEQRVLNVLADRKPYTIKELKVLFTRDAAARLAGVYKGWTKRDVDETAQSYVRNSLRKLVRLGWVEQVDRGTYRLTSKALDRLRRLRKKHAA
jgi:predicted transcriptional regulator